MISTTITGRPGPVATTARRAAALLRRLFAARAGRTDDVADDSCPSVRHVVRPGETAESIASRHGVSTASLLVRNGLGLRRDLEPGTVLVVDAACHGAADADRGADDIPRHDVRSGDTLEVIARRHDVSPRVLLAANGLACAASIAPGMTLVIPRSTDPRDTGEIPVIPLRPAAPSGVSSAA